MELSFVISALRRRYWIVIAFAVLGVFLIGMIRDESPTTYQSDVVLFVNPPQSGSANNLQAGQLERYVASQIGVLSSGDLAQVVADRVGEDMTAAAVAASIEIEQVPDTDNVLVSAVADSPERAQQIAEAHADAYLEVAALEVSSQQERRQSELDTEIDALTLELEAVNNRLAEAVAPYLEEFNDAAAAGLNTQPVPDPGLIDPAAKVMQTSLQTSLSQLVSLRNELEFDSNQLVTSRIVQNATLPEAPVPNSDGLITMAGLVVGGLLGVIVALMSVQLSPRVLDAVAVADLLEIPIAGELSKSRTLSGSPAIAFDRLPSDLDESLDQLCIRAESMARVDRAIRVAVAGTGPLAGTTTLALGMVNRFAAVGYKVVLVDADAKHAFITGQFCAPGDRGSSAIIDALDTGKKPTKAFSVTGLPNVRVIGLDDPAAPTPIRRDVLSSVVGLAEHGADVVVMDLGAVHDSAVIRQISEVVDSVVLAVPLRKQRIDTLKDSRRLIGESGAEKLVPVLTFPGRSRATPGLLPELHSAAGTAGVTEVSEVASDAAAERPSRQARPSSSDPDDDPARRVASDAR